MLMYLMKRLLLFLCASMLFVTLSADEAPYRQSLRRGTHTLQVTAMGHKQQERQVTTTEGSQHLDFSLTPLQVQLTWRGEGGVI